MSCNQIGPYSVSVDVQRIDLIIVRGEEFVVDLDITSGDGFDVEQTFAAELKDVRADDPISLDVTVSAESVQVKITAEQSAALPIGYGTHWRITSGDTPSTWISGRVQVIA